MKGIFLSSIVLVFFFFPIEGVGQQNNEGESKKDRFEKAYMMTLDQLYSDALPIWQGLLEENPDRASLNYFTGVCYMESVNRPFKALKYFEKASQNTTHNFQPFYKSKEAPFDTHFQLGRLHHLNYNFDKAIEQFEKFKEGAKEGHDLLDRVDRHISMAKTGKELVSNPIYAMISNLGPKINSKFKDYCPVLNLDETALYFTSRRLRDDSSNFNDVEGASGKYYEDIYVSYKNEEGNWNAANILSLSLRKNDDNGGLRDLFGMLSEQEHMATSNLSSDGKNLFIYKTQGNSGNLYQTTHLNGEWTKPETIVEGINSDAFESHVDISSDGRDIYFVSDREGGFGGKDIYGVKKLPNGEWSRVYNLGPTINTPYDEDGPFIHPNNKTLYFSSQGHRTMGGFDIFSSEIKSDGTWSKPFNVGYPINTPDDDIYFVVSPDGKRAYYSAHYKGVRKKNVEQVKGYGEEDIFGVRFPGTQEKKLTVLKGYVRGKQCKEMVDDVLITLVNSRRGDTLQQFVPRTRDGGFVSIIPPGDEYSLTYIVHDKKVFEESFNISENTSYQEIKRAINLDTLDLECGDGVVLAANKEKVDPDRKAKQYQEEGGYEKEPVGLLETTTSKREERELVASRQDTSYEEDLAKVDSEEKDESEESTEKETDIGEEDKIASKEERKKPSAFAREVIFEAYFDYNRTNLTTYEEKFSLLIEELKEKVENEGKVKIAIEASASKVPTSRYTNNMLLAYQRVENAKKLLMEKLKAAGVNSDEVNLSDHSVKVQGPEYGKDPENKDKYRDFQYVKIFLN